MIVSVSRQKRLALPAHVTAAPAAAPAISVSHLTKCYSGRPVVHDLCFEVRTGEVFALLGPNGAGKTTTIEILEGYRVPDGGTARVLGIEPWRQPTELHRRIGLMLQQGGFYPTITPREALHLFASFYEKPADPDALLRLVGLEDAARTRYRRLSGGQRQRLSLAVALVGQPELVFLDEPTAGMDPQARHLTWGIIRDLKARGLTVILTTHFIEEAERLADRVAIIDGGRLIALGTPGELTSGAGSDLWLAVDQPIDIAELTALPAARGAREQRPGEYLIESTAPLDTLVGLAHWLRDHNRAPRALRVGRRSLEDVFLHLTGKELRE
ncbi:MAG: ABC transporter ATP-binding protein [Chloroflexi bacterium]|nr:ABC transporter ATP-binding protein [Chloroflexota bacterium]